MRLVGSQAAAQAEPQAESQVQAAFYSDRVHWHRVLNKAEAHQPNAWSPPQAMPIGEPGGAGSVGGRVKSAGSSMN